MLVVRNNPLVRGRLLVVRFRAGDGQWLYIIAAGHSRNSRSLVKALEVYDDLIAEGMVDVPVYEESPLTNNIPDSSHCPVHGISKRGKKLRACWRVNPHNIGSMF